MNAIKPRHPRGRARCRVRLNVGNDVAHDVSRLTGALGIGAGVSSSFPALVTLPAEMGVEMSPRMMAALQAHLGAISTRDLGVISGRSSSRVSHPFSSKLIYYALQLFASAGEMLCPFLIGIVFQLKRFHLFGRICFFQQAWVDIQFAYIHHCV